ncbi:MAG: lipid A deacylase LpxR family protein [bacterium]
MNRLVIISMIFLVGAGCTSREPVKRRQFATQDKKTVTRSSKGSVHPLSFRSRPGTIREASLISLKPATSDSRIPSIIPGKRAPEDTDFSCRLEALRTLDLDLREPVNKKFLLSYIENGPYTSMITLSHEKYLTIQFDNDIFDYTDRFFTSGLRVEFIGPGFRNNPLNYLMIPYWRQCINYYGINVVQNIYTPSTTLKGGILKGDRPYAGILYFGTFKISNDAEKKLRQSSELQLGILGPSSLGGALQVSFHNSTPQNNEPLGWEYQIQNDLLLNYSASLEKGILTSRNCEINLHSSGILGTVFTNISGGVYLRAGLFNPYFDQLFFSKRALNLQRKTRNFQCYLFFDFKGRFVAYDATLQGGLFNRSSSYTIPSADLNRLILEGSAGLIVSYGGIQIKGEQFLLSPEFQNGWWHKWLSIQLAFSF